MTPFFLESNISGIASFTSSTYFSSLVLFSYYSNSNSSSSSSLSSFRAYLGFLSNFKIVPYGLNITYLDK